MWRDLSPTADLSAGSYRMELSAPDAVLDLFVSNNAQLLDLSQRVASATDERVVIDSGGVQWTTYPGTNVQRRTLVLAFRVIDTGATTQAAGAGRAIIAVVGLLAVLAVVLGVNQALLSVERIAQQLPDTAIEDGAAAARLLAGAVRLAVIGGVIVGGVIYADRAGWLGARS